MSSRAADPKLIPSRAAASRDGRPLAHPTQRRAKILATLGPSTARPGMLERLVDAGLDAVRINCAHGTEEEWAAHAESARLAAERAGRPLAVLIDLAGPKIRLAPDTPERRLERGERVVLSSSDDPAPDSLVVEFPGFCGLVEPGRSEIVIGDGTPRMVSVGEEPDPDRVIARCTVAGAIGPRKGVAVTLARRSSPALTEKDLRDLDTAQRLEPDWISLSFVRGGEDVRRLRAELSARRMRALVVAKVEKLEACLAIDQILAEADGVMIGRGDLGVEIGVAEVPLRQKEIIRKAMGAGRLVITATQMLESMINSAEPTRAEAADVANAVLDGTSALMLSGETAIGNYPEEAVRAMAQIALAAERAGPTRVPLDEATPGYAVMQSAVLLADTIRARALVVPTASGASARAASAHRPDRPIIALAHESRVADQLALEWGVVAGVLAGAETLDAFLVGVLEAAGRVGGLRAGEQVVVTSGPVADRRGSTNLIAVERIGRAPSLDPTWRRTPTRRARSRS